jgi:hypothetical protein
MFTTPQQRRGMARMPQGILASGPRIMNAAMQQQAPVRMQAGGLNANEPKFGDDLVDFITGMFTSSSAPGVGDTSGTGNRRRRRNRPAPAVVPPVVAASPAVPTGDMPGAENISSNQPGDVNFGPEVGAEDAAPPVVPSIDLTEQFDDLVESRRPSLPKQERSSTTTLMQALDALRKRHGGDDKETKKYVEEANDLLKEFGIDAPDLKGRKDLRIMEFFLNMAAGQSPDFLTNVAQAGKEAFKGYGEDVREIEAAEQKLKLAGLEMGLAEKARDEAAEQAILLKEYDITADAFEKISDLPDKSQQIQVLMESYGVPQADAIKMVYPGKTVTPQGYELRLKGFVDSGHSPTVAHYLATGGATLLASLAEGNPIGESIASVATAGGQPLTVADARILGVETTAVGD